MAEQECLQSPAERFRYRNSFAATLLFSGVQIYQIIIRIINSKFVALFIGPTGMGIQSLFLSTTDTIYAATNLGLSTSSVKTIAAANHDGNSNQIARNVTAQRRLIFITGVIGMLLCAALAPVWSLISFGNNDYIWSFVAISVIILLDQLNKGELALLQGMQMKKQLARANVIGQTLNAFITIPLYYFFGLKAIVAAFVIGAMISLLVSSYYSRRLIVAKIDMSWSETITYGKEMIKLGFFLSLQFLMSMIVIWIVRNYVSNVGGIEDVGLYSAGTAIVASYIGLVFSAIAADYFPRLAATKNNEEMNLTVRIQAELTILLLTPLVVAFLVFIRPIIILLYSDKFLPIEIMMYWAIGAVLFQSMGWAISYTLLAKAKPTYFFLNELAAAAWGLPIKLLCYKYWGLTGFGMATFIVYTIYMVQVLIVAKKLFGLSYEWSTWRMFILMHIPVVLSAILKIELSEIWGYVFGTIVLIIVGVIVLIELNKKMDLKGFFSSRINSYQRSAK